MEPTLPASVSLDQSFLFWWALWKAAEYTVQNKLRTPLGKAQDTLQRIEGELTCWFVVRPGVVLFWSLCLRYNSGTLRCQFVYSRYIYVMCCLFVSECWASGRCNNDDIITNYSTNCWMYFVLFIDLQLQFVITSVKLSDNRSPQKPHRKATPRFLHEPRRLLHGLPCSIPISYCSFSTTLRSWSTTRTKELLFLSALSTK